MKDIDAMIAAIRMNDVENRHFVNLFLGIGKSIAPRPVDVKQLAFRGDALDKITHVFKQIPEAEFTFS